MLLAAGLREAVEVGGAGAEAARHASGLLRDDFKTEACDEGETCAFQRGAVAVLEQQVCPQCVQLLGGDAGVERPVSW